MSTTNFGQYAEDQHYTTADREPTTFESVHQSIGRLEEQVASLTERLGPVLRPDYDADAKVPMDGPMPVISDLRAVGNRLDTAIRRLAMLSERLEV